MEYSLPKIGHFVVCDIKHGAYTARQVTRHKQGARGGWFWVAEKNRERIHAGDDALAVFEKEEHAGYLALLLNQALDARQNALQSAKLRYQDTISAAEQAFEAVKKQRVEMAVSHARATMEVGQ